jgi:hypothetical protein
MKFEIIPKKSAGPIQIGQTRENVRKAANSNVEEFMKTPTSASPTDAFDELGIHVYYDKQDRCEAIELWSESNPTYKGVSLFDMSPKQAISWLRKLDKAIEIDDVGAISRKMGISLYANEGIDNSTDKIDSVMVFGEGYYD